MDASVSKVVPFHRFLLPILTLVLIALAPITLAQSPRKQVEGVKNFGRVTARYFRGGAVTPAGVDNLAAMGVRTIIDLRDKPSPGEPEACKRNGIKYHKFPMDGSVTPNEKAVNQILSIIRSAKEPVYVHCSAGKHRAGTIAALYRIRVQGWSKARTWAEQQTYGFGPAKEHAALYAYVYDKGSASKDLIAARTSVGGKVEGKSSKSKKYADEEQDKSAKGHGSEKDKSSERDDDDDKDKSSKKADKLAKSKKHDDDDDDKSKDKNDKKSKRKNKVRSESTSVATGS